MAMKKQTLPRRPGRKMWTTHFLAVAGMSMSMSVSIMIVAVMQQARCGNADPTPNIYAKLPHRPKGPNVAKATSQSSSSSLSSAVPSLLSDEISAFCVRRYSLGPPSISPPFPLRESVGSQPLTIQYLGGPIMYKPIRIFLIWYGTWTESQKRIVRRFISSLRETKRNSTTIVPTVFDWWKIISDGYWTDYKIEFRNGYFNTEYLQTPIYASNKITLQGEYSDGYSLGKRLDVLSGDAVERIVRRSLDVNGGPFPAEFLNGYYAVLTSNDVRFDNGRSFCALGFCGYHGWTLAQPNNVSTPLIFSFQGLPAQLPQDVPPLTRVKLGDGSSISAYAAPPLEGVPLRPVVVASSTYYSNLPPNQGQCLPGYLDPKKVRGKIVFCPLEGGTIRLAVDAVQEAGAVGLILGVKSVRDLVGYLAGESLTPEYPVIFVNESAGNAILAYIRRATRASAAVAAWARLKSAPESYPLPCSDCIPPGLSSSNSPSGDAAMDSLLSIFAHELAEAATDPFPYGVPVTPETVWLYPMMKPGWITNSVSWINDSSPTVGLENGDVCAYCYGSAMNKKGLFADSRGRLYNVVGRDGSKYLLQAMFSAKSQECEPYID